MTHTDIVSILIDSIAIELELVVFREMVLLVLIAAQDIRLHIHIST